MATTSRSKRDPATDAASQVAPRVVLCGSMTALRYMERIREMLTKHGIDAVAPEPDVEEHYDQRAAVNAKREASKRHFSWIKDERTRAILVVNVDRDGRHDYIGPNAFAEIAIAFSEGRKVFLYQGIPDDYQDELTAWGVTCLHGDLGPLESLAPRKKRNRAMKDALGQGALFASA